MNKKLKERFLIYFAAKVLQPLTQVYFEEPMKPGESVNGVYKRIARTSFNIAQAMVDELERRKINE